MTSEDTLPSPQYTVYVPDAPPTGIVIDSPGVVVRQVVTKWAGSMPVTVTVRVAGMASFWPESVQA